MERDTTGDISRKQLSSRERVLGDFSKTPIEIKESGFFIDEAALEQEGKMLSDEISTAQDAIVSIPGRTQRDTDSWESLERKFGEINEFKVVLARQQLQMLDNPTGHTVAEISKLRLWDLANLLSFRATLSQLHAIAKKDSIEDKYTRLSQLLSFDMAPELSIRVGQVSIQDFLSFNRKTTGVSPFYQYLTEAQLIRANNAYEQVLAQNQEYPYNKYPNLTRQAIDLLPGKVSALTFFKPSSITSSENLVGSNSTVGEAVKRSDNLMKKVQDVSEESYRTILDPTSKDFFELSQLVQRYLESGDINLKLAALNLMLSDKKDLIIEAYRKALKYEREDNNGEFYMILGDAISEYIEEASPFMNILTSDDVDLILDGEKIEHDEEKSEPTFEQLGKRVNNIFSITSNRNFAMEPSDIDWSQLHLPEEVEINFDTSRPRKFTLKITFNNELGETTEIECAFDTVKNFMDWNHPEDPMSLPEDSNLTAFKRSLLITTQSILDSVYKQAQEEYQSRHASQATLHPVETRRPKRERVQDPIYQLRKTARVQKQEERETTNILYDVLSKKEEVKNRVVLPSEEGLESIGRSLSHVDRDIVRQSIEEYNEKGTGARFARKKGLGLQGEPVYGLSIGCTVPKGARVLLRETESEGGTGIRNFEIIDIRYRKDIYSKHKL